MQFVARLAVSVRVLAAEALPAVVVVVVVVVRNLVRDDGIARRPPSLRGGAVVACRSD